MKKAFVMALTVFMVVVIGQIVYADAWPPQWTGFIVKMKADNKVCAIYTGSTLGALKISTATIDATVSGGYKGVVNYDCTTNKSTLTCTSPSGTKTAGTVDSYTIKCGKIAGPVSTSFVSF